MSNKNKQKKYDSVKKRNKELYFTGMEIKATKYAVVTPMAYGVYADYQKLEYDIREYHKEYGNNSKFDIKKFNNCIAAEQYCYKEFDKNYKNKRELTKIEFGNELIRLPNFKLFSSVN